MAIRRYGPRRPRREAIIRTHRILVLLVFVLTAHHAFALGFEQCSDQLPFGEPKLKQHASVTPLCHEGYAALVDNDLLVPRWVAYTLTRAHTLGCLDREQYCHFHADEALDPDHRATPNDYATSGYDKGHLAPAADFSWDQRELTESCSMANIAPQVPGLNRKEWERLEETVRSWAYDREKLVIFVGPVIHDRESSIGTDHVSVPVAFWKVVVDPEQQDALAFEMRQEDIPKGPLQPFQTSLSQIEEDAAITLPLPDAVDRESKPSLWKTSISVWNKRHKAACEAAGE